MSASDRVLFLLGSLSVGGSERKIVRLANQLAERGRPVELAYLRLPDVLLPQVRGRFAVTYLKEEPHHTPFALWRLARLVRRSRISTVVAVNLYPSLFGLPAVRLFGGRSSRMMVSVNTSEYLADDGFDYMKIYAPLLRRVDQTVFGASSQQGAWLTRYGLDSARARTIYNGVDTEHFAPHAIPDARRSVRESLGIGPDEFVFVCVGNLRPEKAHVNQLESLALMGREYALHPRLLLVGNGTERERIEQHAHSLGVERQVHLVGEVEDVRPYLAASDAFVLSSVAVETFSNAALEAAASGLPVILSDVGGAREMFPDCRGGMVYQRHDIEGLAESMIRLQAPGEAAREGQFARSVVEANFSLDHMTDAWDELLWGENPSPTSHDMRSVR